jgi:uncharacterized oligopeptide transporter (OPT) family protein
VFAIVGIAVDLLRITGLWFRWRLLVPVEQLAQYFTTLFFRSGSKTIKLWKKGQFFIRIH